MKNNDEGMRVFLAHSSEDKLAVRDIYHLLQIDGFVPWLDEFSLVPGQDWELEIHKAIENSQAVAVFLSKNSMDKAGYVQKELALALDYALRQPEGRIYIIPIRLEECTVPEKLKHLHWIELPETGFSIGQAYLRLQRSMIVRAIHGGKLDISIEMEPWFEPFFYGKMIPDSYPIINIENWYLVRGENPDGSRYYGTASISSNNDIYTLNERIGVHEVTYSGRLDESRLIFSGKGYTVSYPVSRNDGVLLGEWGEGGVEELIHASRFMKSNI